MKKLTLLLCLFAMSTNAQEIVAELQKEEFKDVDGIGGSFTKYDLDSNKEGFELQFRYNNSVFVSSYSKVNGDHKYLLAADRNIPLPFYESILSKNKKIYIFYDGYKLAQAKATDLSGNVEASKFYDINMKKKRLMATFEHNNRFYLLSNPKKTEVLNFQIIDEDLNFIEKNIDLINSDYQHINEKGIGETNQSDITNNIIQKSTEFIYSDFELTALRTNQPNTIESITQNKKLYLTTNGIRITYDNDSFSLTIIDVDLNTFKSSIKRIDKPKFVELENKKIISNSYILNNHIFLVKGNKKKCLFSIYDLNMDEYIFNRYIEPTDLLFEEHLLVDQDTWSRFNLKGAPNKNNSSIKKRLINIMRPGNEIGLQVYDTGDNYFVKFGSHRLGLSESLPITYIGFEDLSANIFSVENSLNFYLNKSDFSLTYNPKKSASVKINEFLKQQFGNSIDMKTSWPMQFKQKDDFYLGYVDNKERTYYLRKFN